MNLFRRGRKQQAPASGPLHPDDNQWFRPAEPTNRGAKKRKSAAKRPVQLMQQTQPVPRPVTPDDETQTITPPPDWLDDTTQIPRVDGSAPAAAGGAGGTRAAAKKAAPRPPRRKRSKLRRVAWGTLTLLTLGFIVVLVAYARITIPDANAAAVRQTTRVYYAGGSEEIGRFGDVNRTEVTLDKMPQSLRDAVLAAENRNFYSDSGISPKGITRALWVNLRGGSAQQGGSTITQQYVKNYYLTPARTLKRKVREALLSIKIDQKLSKDQILEDYLNTIYLGRGAYGVQAAAKAYFGVDVSQLTPGQSVLLASIIRAPSRYDPSDKEGLGLLKARWAYVADAMVATHTLNPQQRAALVFPKFPKQAQSQSRYGGQRGYILTTVRNELLARGLSREQIDNGGYRVVTTLDKQAQESALAAVAKEFPKTKNKGLRVGLVAVQPKTGNVMAMYGGKDFLGKDRYAQVNAAYYPIQPGSTLKIFTTAALLENGYTMDSVFTGNSPLHLPGSKPVRNEFNKSYGSVTLQRALDESINTAFVQATFKLGSAKVRDAIEAAGIPHDTPGLETNARITLGIASVRPVLVADAVATLCGGGIHAEQHIVDKVYATNGGEAPLRKPVISPNPVFPPEVVSKTIAAMEDVVKHGTGTAALKLHRPVAGKTGTHQSLTAWFSGCTPQLAGSVVYFKGDGTKSLDGVAGLPTFFGAVYPAATWTTFMKGALRGQQVEKFPVATADGQGQPTANPNQISGSQPVAPPEGGTVLQFPGFDNGPSSYTPAPKVTPTPTATGKSTAKPSAKPVTVTSAVCTNDRKKATQSVPYDARCSADGRLGKTGGGAPAARGGAPPPT
ncbi:MAG TPA: transglycosylase domain-containing protein [Sporichthyaceae bacterium]|jgi:membrane peptidoglycan carboxypeptidase